MRVAVACLAVSLIVACESDVPKYELNPGTPTIQIPTRLTLSALPGIGATATQAVITAKVLDQENRGIPNAPVSFAASHGTLAPINISTNSNGDAQTTLTSGVSSTVTVAGAGFKTSIDVTITAPLSVSLSLRPPEKNQRIDLRALVTPTPSPPVRYVWNFGDGQTAQTDIDSTSHAWAEDGRVTVEVSVTDALERAGLGTAQVTVRDNPEPPAPPPPPLPPGPSLTVTLSASPAAGVRNVTPIVLTPTATPANGAGAALSYDWDLDGNGTFETTTTGPLTANTAAAPYPGVGTFVTKVRANSTTIGVTGTASVLVAITN